jgi:hypothetical protein
MLDRRRGGARRKDAICFVVCFDAACVMVVGDSMFMCRLVVRNGGGVCDACLVLDIKCGVDGGENANALCALFVGSIVQIIAQRANLEML